MRITVCSDARLKEAKDRGRERVRFSRREKKVLEMRCFINEGEEGKIRKKERNGTGRGGHI